MLVVGPRLRQLGLSDERLLLRPALVHALQAPLDAAAGGANRLVADENENRVRVRRGEYAQRHPAAALDRNLETHLLKRTVRANLLPRDRVAVHDDLERNVARCAHARTFEIPIRLLTRAQVANRVIRLLLEPRGHAGGEGDGAGGS